MLIRLPHDCSAGGIFAIFDVRPTSCSILTTKLAFVFYEKNESLSELYCAGDLLFVGIHRKKLLHVH